MTLCLRGERASDHNQQAEGGAKETHGSYSAAGFVRARTIDLKWWWGGPPGPQPTSSSACWDLEKADFAGEERVQGDPRRPGGLPHDCIWIPTLGKLSGMRMATCPSVQWKVIMLDPRPSVAA